MDLLQSFNDFVLKENLFTGRDSLLIAVSGGMDSAVLCELCRQSGFGFRIAHCNFNLRGHESKRDEDFVKTLGEKYGVQTFIKNFDTANVAKQQRTGIEETARKLRYNWFSELLSAENAVANSRQFILTAHHADDNIETVMMNFFRGTGIKGLRGILPKNDNIIRPLLFAGRSEIEHFARHNQLEFVTDSTNADSDYTRNYFRNDLIPSIEKVFPGVKKNILQNINRFAGIELLYEQSIHALKQKLIQIKGNEVHIPVLKLLKTKPLQTVIYEIIKDYGFVAAQVSETEKLLHSSTGKYILSPTHRMLHNRQWLVVTALQSNDAAYFLIEEETLPSQIKFAGAVIAVQKIKGGLVNDDLFCAMTDIRKLQFPLLLRRWKQGDYFYPLGMQKKKKLSRFFTDQKISLAQKEQTWVIESFGKIVWVVGMRIDDRFKITPSTKEMLQIKWLPAQ